MHSVVPDISSTKSVLKDYSLSIVIPSYNDETTVGRLVADTNKIFSSLNMDYEIVCTNDGSRDNTLDVLRDLQSTIPNLRIINHTENKGYGQTIRELYFAGSKDLIASLPGDYQYAPQELLKMALGLNAYDMIIGLRAKRNDPPRRKLQSAVYNLMLRALYGIKHKDMNSIKLFKRSILDSIELNSLTPFVDAELCIRADHAGFRIIELPIEHLPRTSAGASGGKFSVIFETFLDLIKMRPTL
jgi:glycosyltransferase involved in cell wall biosynthesis